MTDVINLFNKYVDSFKANYELYNTMAEQFKSYCDSITEKLHNSNDTISGRLFELKMMHQRINSNLEGLRQYFQWHEEFFKK